ncbi:MAG: glycosyltransferase, partial [Verrucomicrobiota bacterium]
EEAGIDAAEFWSELYYGDIPHSYEETRSSNHVDMLASGIFASSHINSVSETFLHEVADGWHSFVPDDVQREIANKRGAGCASGILNAPDLSFDPSTDEALITHFDHLSFPQGKRRNKWAFQERMGLREDDQACLFFWPSRLDPVQKGPQLLSDLLYEFISAPGHEHVQIAIVANGTHQPYFHDIIRMHDLMGQVAICDFDEELSRLGYAASDFMIMPSLFEPCGLPQMIAPIYGSLPIVHATGGLRDTVEHLNVAAETGNGFVFEHHDVTGLRWALEQALDFFKLAPPVKEHHVRRIIQDARQRFNHGETARAYIKIYNRILGQSILEDKE